MIILKVFNNNSVVALSDDRQDVIVTGSGVGFHKKPGDLVDERKSKDSMCFKMNIKSALSNYCLIYPMYALK